MKALHAISRLDRLRAPAFYAFTFAHLRPVLAAAGSHPDVVAIGADLVGCPSGLILGLAPQGKQAQLLSLFVHREYRRAGVGQALLRQFEQEALRRQCTGLTTGYTESTANGPFEALLGMEGWADPVIEAYVYHARIERFREAPWYCPRRIGRQFRVLQFTELGGEARERLVAGADVWYPAHLSPFKDEFRIEPTHSLFLMDEQGVAGWSVVHRIAADTLLYNSLFIRVDLRTMGYPIMLLSDALHRQEQAGIPYGMFAVLLENAGMLRLVDRWFLPYVDRISKRRVRGKRL